MATRTLGVLSIIHNQSRRSSLEGVCGPGNYMGGLIVRGLALKDGLAIRFGCQVEAVVGVNIWVLAMFTNFFCLRHLTCGQCVGCGQVWAVAVYHVSSSKSRWVIPTPLAL